METKVAVTLDSGIEIEIELPNGRYAYVTWEPGAGGVSGEGLVLRDDGGRHLHGFSSGCFTR